VYRVVAISEALSAKNRPAYPRQVTVWQRTPSPSKVDPQNYQTGTWYWDEPFYLGGSGGTERSQPLIFQDRRGIAFPKNWGSAHDGGAQFLFADGSVHLIAYATPSSSALALMTPNGGEATPEF
jgi:prepilin-type processing-associated H-X9-DG protein